MKPRLIIVAHGSSVNPSSAAQVVEHTAALTERPAIADAFAQTSALFLKQAPLLEEAELAGPIVVVPYFMAQGYFVEKVLPRYLPNDARTAPALGTADFLPLVTAAMSEYPDSHLVLAGHGTERDPRSGATVLELARRCRSLYPSVTCGFVDQQPGLDTVWDRVPDDGRAAVVVPYFAFPGPHTQVDIPEALGLPSGDFTTHELDERVVHYLPPITSTPRTVDVLEALALSMLRDE